MNRFKIRDFLWLHFLLLISLFLLSLGVALCVRSDLGSSVISSAPYVFTIAGERGVVPAFTLGMYTNILNVALVIGQILVLRRNFQLVQLLQLVIGIVFGVLIDFSMYITAAVECSNVGYKILVMIVGASVMALGVAMEIRCASITMPGEGLPAAISRQTGKPFATVKIWVDVCLVAIAVISEIFLLHGWLWSIVGGGTLFAMLYCGMAVKFISNRIGWFDRLLGYKPGFRRYFFGLSRYIRNPKTFLMPNKSHRH